MHCIAGSGSFLAFNPTASPINTLPLLSRDKIESITLFMQCTNRAHRKALQSLHDSSESQAYNLQSRMLQYPAQAHPSETRL